MFSDSDFGCCFVEVLGVLEWCCIGDLLRGCEVSSTKS